MKRLLLAPLLLGVCLPSIPLPASANYLLEYINIESNISPQRVWLSEASGRMIPLEPRNNRVRVPDQLPSGFYVLTLEIDGSLVQKKVIIDRR